MAKTIMSKETSYGKGARGTRASIARRAVNQRKTVGTRPALPRTWTTKGKP